MTAIDRLEWLLTTRKAEIPAREAELVKGFNAFLAGEDGGDVRFSKAVDELDSARADLARLEEEWTRTSEAAKTAIFLCKDGTRLISAEGYPLEFEVAPATIWVEFLDWRDPLCANPPWSWMRRIYTTEAPPPGSIPQIPRRRFRFHGIEDFRRVFKEE